MRRSYFSFEEQEAYNSGRRDASNHRLDYEHDRYSSEPTDQAYWQGRVDEAREDRIRQEERERQEYEEMIMMQRQDERRREEEEYEMYLQALLEQQMLEEYPEPPIDELQPDELTTEEMLEISKEQFFLNTHEDNDDSTDSDND